MNSPPPVGAPLKTGMPATPGEDNEESKIDKSISHAPLSYLSYGLCVI